MIECKCETLNTIMLSQLVPFQGDLKKRTVKDIKALAESLKTDGLLMPFVIWQSEEKCCILDGHGRLAALTDIALEDSDVMNQAFPCIYIDADTEEEAKKALLQITSQYGKVTKDGITRFIEGLEGYKAPIVAKFTRKPVKRRKYENVNTDVILTISVPSDKIEQFKQVISDITYARILR